MITVDTALGYPLETVEYPHSPELSTADIASSVEVGAEFIRPIIHAIPQQLREATNRDLGACLASVDQCFISVARAVGATVVPHIWLLTKDTNHRNQSGYFAHSNGLELFDMPGIWLAAKVPLLEQPDYPSIKNFLSLPEQRELIARTTSAMEEWRDEHGWSLKPIEFTAKQFLYGVVGSSRELKPTTLVDIDIL